MTLPQPPSPVPEVPVEEQFIIGFGDGKTIFGSAVNAQQKVDTALSTLLQALDALLLRQPFVAEVENKAYFAIAVIGVNGPKQTLADVQEEINNGKQQNKPGYEHIAWVEPNRPIALAQNPYNDPLLPQQWALNQLGATRPWTPIPPAGPRTIVAIVDSGLRLAGGGLHADLDPARVEALVDCQPPGFYSNNVDRDGHGTLLAGTIAAWSNNNVGIASAIPPGWNINLMPVKFFDPPGQPTVVDAVLAIAWAASRFYRLSGNLVKVINASWHVPGGAMPPALLVTTTFAGFLGCLVVFAAGNDGTDNQVYPFFPANLNNNPLLQGHTLTVLATDRYNAKAFYSNYGSNTVDLGAPGIHILSTARYLGPGAAPRYSQYSGTSPAAAHVSAAAALIFALNPGWTPADVVQHLTTSADQIPALANACIRGRRLNLDRAVNGPLEVVTPVASLQRGVPFNIRWNVRYNNPAFTNVDIAFSNGGGPYTRLTPRGGVAIGARTWQWQAPLPVTSTPGGQIRITPTTGNFPALSGLFTVI